MSWRVLGRGGEGGQECSPIAPGRLFRGWEFGSGSEAMEKLEIPYFVYPTCIF